MNIPHGPGISILLPTYKDAPLLLNSINSVISQTYQEWELIIIDDGLSAKVRHNVMEYIKNDQRIILLPYEGNTGIQKSLNKGLSVARGKYIARIDDDDAWIDQQKLEKQFSFLEKNDGAVLVGTQAIIHGDNNIPMGTYELPILDNDIRARILLKNCFLHPSIVMRKSAVDSAGGYNDSEKVRHIEDYALWLKLGMLGSLHNIADVCVDLRIHNDSLTFKNRIIQAKKIRLLIKKYKHSYPNFLLAYIVLSIRIIGFYIIQYVPIPKKVLYSIQRIYKKI